MSGKSFEKDLAGEADNASPVFVSADPDLRGAAREFIFTQKDFGRIREIIYRHAGISLGNSKFDMVYSRLARRLRALKLRSFAEYLGHLENNAGEYEAFINALTTNLTSFFREAHHFPIMAGHMKQVAATREVKMWSCAASTGEEPYSMAIQAMEEFGTILPPVTILATDVDTNVLEKARQGVYPMERVSKLPQAQLKRFFLKGDGKNAGLVRVRPELQRLVAFQKLNLLEARWSLGEKFDIIFCRNVLIYFDKQTQREILTKLAAVLRPDGLLFAGHSESFCYTTDIFETCGKTVYKLRRPC